MPDPAPICERRVVFQFLVPVHVEVVGGDVVYVLVRDDTPVSNAVAVEGDRTYLAEAVEAASDGQAWPAWRFG
jgi:hypothetical protein